MHAYRPTLYGTRHAVSAGHYLAAMAGFAILEAGGNAVDAGVAAGIALGVLQCDLVNVGGVAPIILYDAKSDAVHRALKALLAARRLRREYLALVEGTPSARSGTIDAPIGRHRRERTLMSIDSEYPRAARTHFEVERFLPEATFLRVVLETGRTHQIRVHMAAIGHPVAGDSQYGGARSYGLKRQFLHAARLAFEHPVSHAAVDVHSLLPGDLARALAVAARGAAPTLEA